jgi:anthranilate/para-aminobenzoate synthase component I
MKTLTNEPIEVFESQYQGFGDFILESLGNSKSLGRNSFIGLGVNKLIKDFKTLREKNYPYAFGYTSYDFGLNLEKIKLSSPKGIDIPEICFLVPKILITYDHWQSKYDQLTPASEISVDKGRNIDFGEFVPAEFIGQNLSKKQFTEIVKKTKEYIKAGDIYQANLSQIFKFKMNCHPFLIYKRLRKINPSPFSSYFDLGRIKIISSSPERLIKLENWIAETRPIAGTRPIYAKENELLLNPKERAEHIMLVDLERNDLGRACEYGSVKVNELMTIEKYSHVSHIVSNVVGKLRKDKDMFDLFLAMFPGGTITGCPKIRCMEIIDELEPVKRGLYTGSIGYFMPNCNRMDMNIVIRTIVVVDDIAYVQVGAGIVADSDPELEYHETVHKGRALFSAMGLNYEDFRL